MRKELNNEQSENAAKNNVANKNAANKNAADKMAANNSVSSKENLIATISINDLRYKEYNDLPMTEEELTALANYDHYRLERLNGLISDAEFHQRYRELQTIANLGDFREFLKPQYFQNKSNS